MTSDSLRTEAHRLVNEAVAAVAAVYPKHSHLDDDGSFDLLAAEVTSAIQRRHLIGVQKACGRFIRKWTLRCVEAQGRRAEDCPVCLDVPA